MRIYKLYFGKILDTTFYVDFESLVKIEEIHDSNFLENMFNIYLIEDGYFRTSSEDLIIFYVVYTCEPKFKTLIYEKLKELIVNYNRVQKLKELNYE